VVFGHHDRLTFLVHPQLGLVPAGLIVLAAEPVNRGRLRPVQGLALRYAGLLLVYLPSTADMFLTGLGHGVQLLLVLALLSVAGVLLGTLLRVRAFLFLGVTFLSLDVFAHVWQAAVDRGWNGLVGVGHRPGRGYPDAVRAVRGAPRRRAEGA
jgi:hypothetical protein